MVVLWNAPIRQLPFSLWNTRMLMRRLGRAFGAQEAANLICYVYNGYIQA
jgi:hypothetical protein